MNNTFKATVLLMLINFHLHSTGSCQRIVTGIEKLQRGYKFSLVIWSHPFVGIYFVNDGTNSVSFEMVRTKKNIVKNLLFRNCSRNLLLYCVSTTMLT